MMKKISRKKFLQISSLGIASLAFSTPLFAKNIEKSKHEKYNIIILGSSLEALITAKKLSEKGLNNFLLLDIIENKNTSTFPSPVLISENETETFFWLQKQEIPYFEISKKGKTTGKIQLEESEKTDIENTVFELQKMAKNINWQALQHDKKASIYDEMLLSDFLENHLHTLTANALFAHKIDEIFGCQTDEISLLYFLYFLEKKLPFDISNNDNQYFIIDEKLSSISEKLKKSFSEKMLFTQTLENITQTENEVFIYTENKKIVASKIIVAADFLQNEKKAFSKVLNNLLQQKKLEKTSFCIKLTYETAFWRDENHSGRIISFSGLLSQVFDISLPHEKIANLLIYPDSNHFAELSEKERKSLIIDELSDLLGEKALSYVQYKEYTNVFQHEDISRSFLQKNKQAKASSKNVFWLEKMPIINNELANCLQAADSVLELLLQEKMV